MAKIAVKFESFLEPPADKASGSPARCQLAFGDGWTVSDVICTAGPHDRAFEEQHSAVCIAVVFSGSFQYQTSAGRELMTPGSLLLGHAGQYFTCSHEHASGDRCIAFEYLPQYFERLAEEAGVKSRTSHWPLRVPPVKELSTLVARTFAGLNELPNARDSQRATLRVAVDKNMRPSLVTTISPKPRIRDWEAITLQLAVTVVDIANGFKSISKILPSAEARTTRVVRMIESYPDVDHDLVSLAREAKLSRYHFLRIFQELTGLTPHQYVLRARLRRAAMKLISEPARVLDVALDTGFKDLSNFNRGFRREFNVSPKAYRYSAGRALLPHQNRPAD